MSSCSRRNAGRVSRLESSSFDSKITVRQRVGTYPISLPIVPQADINRSTKIHLGHKRHWGGSVVPAPDGSSLLRHWPETALGLPIAYPGQAVVSGIIVSGISLHMIAFSAHFDGKVIVPEHAVDLPRDLPLVVHVETLDSVDLPGESAPVHALQWLADNAVDDDLPSDLSAQHDHYLYGTPKRG